MPRKVETSIRFSPGTMEKLRMLAHLRSLETGKQVSWNQLVRECVETHLVPPQPGRPVAGLAGEGR